MFRRRCFLLCAFPALCAVSRASDDRTPAASAGTRSTDTPAERGIPALFSWGDADGDGRLDLAAVSGDGRLQLLVNDAEGRFEDATERLGLAEVGNAALALWGDYDLDSRLDLFVGARSGASRLFRNEGGLFLDMSAGSGLTCEGAVQSAQWLDHDGDGRLDLFVTTSQRNESCSTLFRGLEGGFFERAELPLGAPEKSAGSAVLGNVERTSGGDAGEDTEGTATTLVPTASDTTRDERRGTSLGGRGGPFSGGRIAVTPTVTEVAPLLGFTCASAIVDQANPPACLQASTAPTLGKLYPLSSNLFVAVGGNVGIGTTSPAARLHVDGTARMTDTLTLAPSGDMALDVSTGSIYKAGALFLHTKGGIDNTALGREALSSVTTGIGNTASGHRALFATTAGNYNTASGGWALYSNTTGNRNTACGASVLYYNTTGSSNTALGTVALVNNTTGSRNTAIGDSALFYNTTGNRNTALGGSALANNTTGYENTACGRTALISNTTGIANTASGYRALSSNTIGNSNTASGDFSLFHNTTGDFNSASGDFSLFNNTTGNRNTALGESAGYFLTTGSNNIMIGHLGVAAEGATIRIGTAGTQTRAFIAGIRGVTTGVANAIPVLIDSSGQLGTVSSSRRFKEEIRDMGASTEKLLELRPVVFRYKPEVQSGERPLEYGLIAEEVAEVFPDLVVYDEEGRPFTVKYHLLSSMLLNELEKLAREVEGQRGELARLRELEARVGALEAPSTVAPSGKASQAGR